MDRVRELRRRPWASRLRAGRFVAVVGIGPLVAACASPSASTPPTSRRPASTTTAVPPPTTPTTSTTTTPSSPGRFVPATTPVYEFTSPSQNISCEIDYSPNAAAVQSVLCETISPTRSVVMSADGSLRTCDGMQCGSNAGLNTPTLAYGDSTGAGPFTCTSTASAMVCNVTGGKGFRISQAGITPIGG